MSNKTDKNSNVKIGAMLQKARESGGLSQAKLAGLIGMSVNHVSAIERGASKGSIDTLIGYCTALNMTPDEILGYCDKDILPELKRMLSEMDAGEQEKIRRIIQIVKNC